MSEPYPTVWFITGTSIGVGRAVTEVTLEKGDIVVATARQPNSLDDLSLRYTTDHLLILPLDVTQPDQIAAAFAEAERNARFGRIGELEATEDAIARAQFETNFWGTMRITREALRCFRETKAGRRLLQMSSGLVRVPGASFYCASKFALEGASKSLAAELDPAIISRRDKATPWKDAAQTAEAIFKIACVPDPPLHFVLGKDAIGMARKKVAELVADIDTYEPVSESLEE